MKPKPLNGIIFLKKLVLRMNYFSFAAIFVGSDTSDKMSLIK